jgi:hypothetical protein
MSILLGDDDGKGKLESGHLVLVQRETELLTEGVVDQSQVPSHGV